jgi:hypothetical protein
LAHHNNNNNNNGERIPPNKSEKEEIQVIFICTLFASPLHLALVIIITIIIINLFFAENFLQKVNKIKIKKKKLFAYINEKE